MTTVELPKQIDETVANLYKLSEWVLEILKDSKKYWRSQIKTLALLYAKIYDSLDLLASYEEALLNNDDELANEFGLAYKSAMVDIETKIEDLKESGIQIILQ